MGIAFIKLSTFVAFIGMGVGKPQASLFNRVLAELFGAGEAGIYMPSVHESFLRGDLFQDAAGTTPVTAAGQSVGLALDRSGNGNHASQPTAASRPTLQQDDNGMYVLRFDGVDDFMETPSIDFTSTDKMTVLAGVYKASDAQVNMLLELGPNVNVTDGTVALYTPTTANALNASFRARGVSATSATNRVVPADAKYVLVGEADFTGDVVSLRANTVQTLVSAAGMDGTAFINAPLNVAARNNGDAFHTTGDIYGLIVCGAAKSLAQIEHAEALINRYARAY